MPNGASDSLDETRSALEAGVPVRFDLPSACKSFNAVGLLCGTTEAYIRVTHFGSSFHYARRCANGHFIDNVRHAEVELHFGVPKTTPEKQALVRDILAPSRRIDFNIRLRDSQRCVYCGRQAGDLDLDGRTVVVGTDHILLES
jgi:hypothetical protein